MSYGAWPFRLLTRSYGIHTCGPIGTDPAERVYVKAHGITGSGPGGTSLLAHHGPPAACTYPVW